MATVKKSKKKVIVPICIILVIAIVAGTVFGVVKSKSGEEVKLNTIATGDIYEKVSLTGDVTAGTSKEYKVGTVATVKNVNVKVGDQVKKGDVLATFDTTSLDGQVSSLQTSYNDAVKNYNTAVANQKSAKNSAASLKKEVNYLDKKIAKLKKKMTKTTTTKKKKTTTTKAASTTTGSYSQWLSTSTTKATTSASTTKPTTDDGKPKYTVSLTAYPSAVCGTVTGSGRYNQDVGYITAIATPNAGWQFLGWYANRAAYLAGDAPLANTPAWTIHVTGDLSYIAVFTEDTNSSTTGNATINDIANALIQINNNIASITNDIKTLTTISQIIATTISGAIASGQLNSEAIANLVGKQVQKAITDGIIDSTKFIVESGVAVDMIKAAVSSIDYRALAKGVSDSDNAVLTGCEIQRAILTAAEASGKKIDNRIASETADSLIKAANASNELQYRDSTYDYKNVKLRKHTEYKTSMANQKAAEYGADLARKQGRTHYWDSVSRGLGAVASGVGNVVGTGARFW